jgi:hypothetical protein
LHPGSGDIATRLGDRKMTLPADYQPYVEELEKYISELRNSDGMDIEFDPHSAPLAVSDAAAIAFKLQQVGC